MPLANELRPIRAGRAAPRLRTDLRAALPTWCCLPGSGLQSPKHFQVGVWTCIPNLVSTGGTLLVLVSTVKTAHTTSETQEPRGEKHSPRKELTVKSSIFARILKVILFPSKKGNTLLRMPLPVGRSATASRFPNI